MSSGLITELLEKHWDAPPVRLGRSRVKMAGPVRQLTYLTIDLALAAISAVVAYELRFHTSWLGWFDGTAFATPLADHAAFLLLFLALLALGGTTQKLYDRHQARTTGAETFAVLKTVTVATFVLGSFIYLSGIKVVSRFVVLFAAMLDIVVISGWRYVKRCIIDRRRGAVGGLQHVLIVGAGRVGQTLARYLQLNPGLGYDVRGFLDSNHHGAPGILGRIEDLAEVARAEFVDEIFITIPSARDVVKQMVIDARRLRLDVKVVPEFYDGLAFFSPMEFIGEFPVRVLHQEPIPAVGLLIKRTIDVFGAVSALVCLSPVMLLISLAIKIDSDGPIFYRARRIGKKGKPFTCYKFRTMIRDAHQLKNQLRHLNERVGPLFKISNDPRITRLGRFLRKYSLDEIPQFWNVLLGEMSLVGPRPPEPKELEEYSLTHLRRLDVTPGITGLWQVSARQDPSFERVLALDNQYIDNWSLTQDIRLMLQTIMTVIQGEGQ